VEYLVVLGQLQDPETRQSALRVNPTDDEGIYVMEPIDNGEMVVKAEYFLMAV